MGRSAIALHAHGCLARQRPRWRGCARDQVERQEEKPAVDRHARSAAAHPCRYAERGGPVLLASGIECQMRLRPGRPTRAAQNRGGQLLLSAQEAVRFGSCQQKVARLGPWRATPIDKDRCHPISGEANLGPSPIPNSFDNPQRSEAAAVPAGASHLRDGIASAGASCRIPIMRRVQVDGRGAAGGGRHGDPLPRTMPISRAR